MIGIEEDDNGSKKALADSLSASQTQLVEDAQSKLDEVWDKIYETALMLCPVDTGTLLSTIKIVQGDSGTPEGSSYTPEGSGGEEAITIYDSTIMAGDESVINPKSGMPCIYAQWVHDGHLTRGGTITEPQPFLEDAILEHEAELDEAINDMMDAIGAESGGGGEGGGSD